MVVQSQWDRRSATRLPPHFDFSQQSQRQLRRDAKTLETWWTQSAKAGLEGMAKTASTHHELPLPESGFESIPLPIRSYMQSAKSFRVSRCDFRLSFTNRSVSITLVTFDKASDMAGVVQDAFRKCWTWLQFCDSLAEAVTVSASSDDHRRGRSGSSQCVQDGLQIFLYWTPFCKLVPSSSDPPRPPSSSVWLASRVDEFHINTAFTYACTAQGSMAIFRKEEWFKVFLHETMHAFGFDFASIPFSVSDQATLTLANHFLILPGQEKNGDIMDLRVYEAYTECWAEVYDILMFCVVHKYDFFGSVGQDMLVREREFTKFQLHKLYGGGGDFNWDTLTGSVPESLQGQYKENTYVFSYFLLKWILFRNLPAFFDWCLANNRCAHRTKTPNGKGAATDAHAWFVFRNDNQAVMVDRFCAWIVASCKNHARDIAQDYATRPLYDDLSHDTSFWRETLRMTP